MFAMNLMKMEADISATRAQEAYTELQRKNAETLLPAQLASMEAQIRNADANTYKTYQDAKKAKVEGDNMINTGTSGSNNFSQWFRDLFGAQQKMTDEYHKSIINDKGKGKRVKPDLTPNSKFTPFWTPEGRKRGRKQIDDLNSGKVKIQY